MQNNSNKEAVTGKKMMKNLNNNEVLKSIIEENEYAINILLNNEDIDDNQYARIQYYARLPLLYQCIIYMRSQNFTIKQIADIYDVSCAMVNKMIKKIKTEIYK